VNVRISIQIRRIKTIAPSLMRQTIADLLLYCVSIIFIRYCIYAANPSGNEWDIELVVTRRFGENLC